MLEVVVEDGGRGKTIDGMEEIRDKRKRGTYHGADAK